MLHAEGKGIAQFGSVLVAYQRLAKKKKLPTKAKISTKLKSL